MENSQTCLLRSSSADVERATIRTYRPPPARRIPRGSNALVPRRVGFAAWSARGLLCVGDNRCPMTVEFRLLGLVEAAIDGRRYGIGPAHRWCALAPLPVDVKQTAALGALWNVWGQYRQQCDYPPPSRAAAAPTAAPAMWHCVAPKTRQ
jgi:hypothetical protein